jgi:hypothetical protein
LSDASLRRRTDVAVVLALLALPLLVFSGAVFGGRIFFERDILAYWQPQVETLVRVVAQGSWPLWDPYEGFGMPLLADPGSQVLYPPTWVNLFLKPAEAYTTLVVLHTWWTAVGMYLLARRWGLSTAAAALAAVSWAACGPLVSTVSVYQHFMGASWIPWTLLAVESVLRDPGGRAVAALAASLAAQLFAGSGDMVVMTALAAAIRVAWARPGLRGRRGLVLGGLAAGGFLGAALSAAQWMPTLELVRHSSRAAMSTEANLYWSLHPASLVELFVPQALADLPLTDGWRAALYESREPFLRNIYVGAGGLALVAATAPRLRRAGALAASIVALFVLAALGRHTPVMPLLLAAPPLALFRYPVKYLVPAALFWALLVGLAFETWRAPWTERVRRRARVRAAVLALAALGCAAVALAIRNAPDRLAFLIVSPPDWRAAAVAPLVWRLWATAGVIAVAGGLLVLRSTTSAPRAWVSAALLTLVVVDAASAARGVNALAPRELIAHRPPVLDLMPGDPAGHRIFSAPTSSVWLNRHLVRGPAGWDPAWSWALGAQDSLTPPIGARWGIRGSYDADFTGLAPRGFPTLSAMATHYVRTAVGVRLLRMGGVTEVIGVQKDSFPPLPRVGEVASVFSDPVTVFRVPDPLPRAFVVGGSRALAGDAALLALGDPAFDPSAEVLLEAGLPSRPAWKAGTARLREGRADLLRFETEGPGAGYLVVLDAFDPGWKAAVDGRAAPVRRANVLFRAVEVPAGRHVVEMRYRPAVVGWGVAVSALGAAVLLALAWPARTAGGGAAIAAVAPPVIGSAIRQGAAP